MQKLNFQLFSIKSMVFQSILCEGGNVRKNSRFEGKKGGRRHFPLLEMKHPRFSLSKNRDL